jgi:hypothetical protein
MRAVPYDGRSAVPRRLTKASETSVRDILESEDAASVRRSRTFAIR